jgi:hypothetical protein
MAAYELQRPHLWRFVSGSKLTFGCLTIALAGVLCAVASVWQASFAGGVVSAVLALPLLLQGWFSRCVVDDFGIRWRSVIRWKHLAWAEVSHIGIEVKPVALPPNGPERPCLVVQLKGHRRRLPILISGASSAVCAQRFAVEVVRSAGRSGVVPTAELIGRLRPGCWLASEGTAR